MWSPLYFAVCIVWGVGSLWACAHAVLLYITSFVGVVPVVNLAIFCYMHGVWGCVSVGVYDALGMSSGCGKALLVCVPRGSMILLIILVSFCDCVEVSVIYMS